MTLKDDLSTAITKGFYEIYPMQGEADHAALTEIMLGHVWTTLEDVVGSAQEALFTQLTAARSELEAARQKIDGLTEIVRDLQSQLPSVEESSDE